MRCIYWVDSYVSLCVLAGISADDFTGCWVAEDEDTKKTGPDQKMSCHRIGENQIRCINRGNNIETTYTINNGIITNDDSPQTKGYYNYIRGRHKVIQWYDTRYETHRVLWNKGKKLKLF